MDRFLLLARSSGGGGGADSRRSRPADHFEQPNRGGDVREEETGLIIEIRRESVCRSVRLSNPFRFARQWQISLCGGGGGDIGGAFLIDDWARITANFIAHNKSTCETARLCLKNTHNCKSYLGGALYLDFQ